jgi:hypothetical protein
MNRTKNLLLAIALLASISLPALAAQPPRPPSCDECAKPGIVPVESYIEIPEPVDAPRPMGNRPWIDVF